MALTRLNAPSTAVARDAAKLLQERGYESYHQGWTVYSIAGESYVRKVIAEVELLRYAAHDELPDILRKLQQERSHG